MSIQLITSRATSSMASGGHVGVQLPVIVLLMTSFFALLFRFYARAVLVRTFGYDDFAMGVAFFAFLGVCIAGLILINVVENPVQNLSDQAARTILPVIVLEALYIATVIFIKLSLGIQYLRFAFSVWQKYTIYTVLIVSTIFNTYLFFTTLLVCGVPVTGKHLVEGARSGVCGVQPRRAGLAFAQAAVTTTSDFIFAILPFFMLKALVLNKRQKICVQALLLFALVGSIFSIVRFGFIASLGTFSADGLNGSINIFLFSILETGIGITAGCLSTLRPLFKSFLEGTTGFQSKNTNQTGSTQFMMWRDQSASGDAFLQTFSDYARGLEEGQYLTDKPLPNLPRPPTAYIDPRPLYTVPAPRAVEVKGMF